MKAKLPRTKFVPKIHPFHDFYSRMMECIEGFHYERRLIKDKWKYFCIINHWQDGFDSQKLVEHHVRTHFILVEVINNLVNGFPQVNEKLRDFWALWKSIGCKLVNDTIKIVPVAPCPPLDPWTFGFIDFLQWLLKCQKMKMWSCLLDRKQFAKVCSLVTEARSGDSLFYWIADCKSHLDDEREVAMHNPQYVLILGCLNLTIEYLGHCSLFPHTPS